jgi:hypothetical protein
MGMSYFCIYTKLEGHGIMSWWGGFFLIYLILAALGPGVDSASNRNEYQESFLKKKKPGGKVRPARRADNLAAIC